MKKTMFVLHIKVTGLKKKNTLRVVKLQNILIMEAKKRSKFSTLSFKALGLVVVYGF